MHGGASPRCPHHPPLVRMAPSRLLPPPLPPAPRQAAAAAEPGRAGALVELTHVSRGRGGGL